MESKSSVRWVTRVRSSGTFRLLVPRAPFNAALDLENSLTLFFETADSTEEWTRTASALELGRFFNIIAMWCGRKPRHSTEYGVVMRITSESSSTINGLEDTLLYIIITCCCGSQSILRKPLRFVARCALALLQKIPEPYLSPWWSFQG